MFVPRCHVEAFWHTVIKPMITRSELTPILDYVQKTWIGIPPRDGARGKRPIFSVECWNQHRRVIEERPRHNNFLESHNAKLQKMVKPNPSVWDFLIAMRTAYQGDFQILHQEWVNNVNKPRRTEDVARDRRILQQVRRWSEVEGNNSRLRPEEWAMGMVTAMKD